jgi:hypothetical protein
MFMRRMKRERVYLAVPDPSVQGGDRKASDEKNTHRERLNLSLSLCARLSLVLMHAQVKERAAIRKRERERERKRERESLKKKRISPDMRFSLSD